jgi:hypothetical protein
MQKLRLRVGTLSCDGQTAITWCEIRLEHFRELDMGMRLSGDQEPIAECSRKSQMRIRGPRRTGLVTKAPLDQPRSAVIASTTGASSRAAHFAEPQAYGGWRPLLEAKR